MADPIYDAADIVDKTLVAEKELPYYNGVPDGAYMPVKLGTFPAGSVVGTVYSFIDADPAKNRPQLWWMFYPGSSGSYYYMPHDAGHFDLDALAQQGVLSEEQKQTQNATWYEKILSQVLPIVAISVLGAAFIRGYFTSRKQ